MTDDMRIVYVNTGQLDAEQGVGLHTAASKAADIEAAESERDADAYTAAFYARRAGLAVMEPLSAEHVAALASACDLAYDELEHRTTDKYAVRDYDDEDLAAMTVLREEIAAAHAALGRIPVQHTTAEEATTT